MMRLDKSPGEILLCLVALIGLTVWTGCHKQEGAAQACDLDRLADTLAAIVEEYPGEIGVAVITGEGDTVAVNDYNKYPMMSVFKLHQALAVCRDFDLRGISLDTAVTVRRAASTPTPGVRC